eukprot:TRINITY_DN7988_c0_g2_i11.p1 TRINITY_DN7988_c0_g2~~TRINITY_DN7988_c0_g2_i11.p1  ORF type:complete len:275 (-),score=39.06 TRINITY_DN7988_c0_g2_i11:42-866(-)
MPEEPIIEIAKPTTKTPSEEICVRADCAYYGRGEAQSYRKAFRLYKEAAEAGCARAYGCLGRMYEKGLGVDRDAVLAFEAFSDGAKLKDGTSLFALGKYYEADIVPKEVQPRGMKVAVDYYLKARQYGSHDAVAKLAFMYEHGVYFGVNKAKALDLYKLGARLGNSLCKNWLGLHYYNNREYVRAIRLFKEAKELGCIRAFNNLGLCYEQGLGVEQNIDTSISLYKEAADNNYFPAVYNLGFAYLKRARITSQYEDYAKAVSYTHLTLPTICSV